MPRNPTVPFEDDVIDRLARIEERVSAVPDHETRLRTVEKRQWLLAGVAVGLGPLLSKLGFHFPSM